MTLIIAVKDISLITNKKQISFLAVVQKNIGNNFKVPVKILKLFFWTTASL